MRGALATCLLLLLTFILANPGAAQDSARVVPVATSHPDLGKNLIAIPTKVSYIDADGDNRIDATQPDETVYLDISGDGKVGYGDLRLTRFGDYGPGTLVDVTNRDLGLNLATPSGWFGTIGGAVATFDADFSASLTAGDVRLDGTKVAPGDSAIGTATPIAQGSTSSTQRVGYVDANNNNQRDLGETLVLDMDENSPSGGRRVSQGDVLFVMGSFGTDDVIGRAEFESLQTTPAGQPGGVAVDENRVTSFDWLLVSLAMVNLLGLAYVVREISKKPKNPFR